MHVPIIMMNYKVSQKATGEDPYLTQCINKIIINKGHLTSGMMANQLYNLIKHL